MEPVLTGCVKIFISSNSAMKLNGLKVFLVVSTIFFNAFLIHKTYVNHHHQWFAENEIVATEAEEYKFNFIYNLKNILDDEATLNVSKRQVFFIESHLEKERSLTSAKQACSVESVGKIKSLS